MSGFWGKFSVSTAFAALVTFTHADMAIAADMYPDAAPVFEEEVTPVEFGTGWYIRTDIAIGSSINLGGSNTDYWGGDTLEFTIPSSLSIGAGTNIFDSVRVDFTLERFNNLTRNLDGGNCGTAVNGGDCSYSSQAEADATGLMINAYYDLSIWKGFTPYVGGGVGFANLEWTNFSVIGFDAAGAVVSAPVLATEARLTAMANVQAGLALDISDNMALDFGYRLTGIYGDSFRDTAAAATGQKINHDTGMLFNHEIRVGLRYKIW